MGPTEQEINNENAGCYKDRSFVLGFALRDHEIKNYCWHAAEWQAEKYTD